MESGKLESYRLTDLFSLLIFFGLVIIIDISDIIYFFQTAQYQLMLWTPLKLLFLFLAPLPIVKNKIRIYSVILAILAIIGIYACFPVIYFKTRIGESIITLIWHTNFQEAWELTRGYIVRIAIITLFSILFLILLIRKLPKRIPKTKSYIISLSSIAFLAFYPVVSSSNNQTYPYRLSQSIGECFPFYTISNLYKFLGYQKYIKNYDTEVKGFKFNAVKKDTLKQREVVILIIGESSRYDHWGLNGYGRNTSPKLDVQPNLLTFTNVSAAGAITEMSVPIIITRATPDDYLEHTQQKSIISLFREAGFDTYWITNQDDNGNIYIHEKEAGKVIRLLAPYNATTNQYRDMKLVDTLKEILSENRNNLFIVLHTMGSHWDYRIRYTSQFELFRPTGKGKFLSFWPINKVKFINSYDNTILYTDCVIDSVIQLCNKYSKISSVVYLSDHGENLFDDSRNYIFHAAANISKYTAHIPLFIYTSPLFDSLYPQKIKALDSHKTSKISGSDIFDTMADLGNISYSKQDLTRSIASPRFIESQQKICLTPSKSIKYSALH